ncbi:MAG TPA: DAK2 domain-containing protein [Micromonosporaceae bacterium]
MLDSLDAAAVRRWCAMGLRALRRHQAEIDELNVYPVPDGDTGTNLVLTLGSAWEALEEEPAARAGTPGEAAHGSGRASLVLHRMARGALMGARGNSGVILAQLLRAAAEALDAVAVTRGRALATALSAAAEGAYTAVAEPVEGTVLSVATGAALAAREADTDDLARVVIAAAEGATEALLRTPEQLPVLARAGVVDAGGRGLVVLLDALVEVVTGQAPVSSPPSRVGRDRAPLTVTRETGSSEYAYEVQYLLDAPAEAVTQLRAQLATLGDSLVIVGSGLPSPAGADNPLPVWNIHVHVNDVGAALEAGIRSGRPHRVSVTRFGDESGAGTDRAVDPGARGLVVVATGAGLAKIFAGEGAVVVSGEQGNNPSTRDVLAAVRATGAGRVVVLPNDPNVLAVAQAAAEQARTSGVRVGVVPTKSPVQAMAAIAVRDHDRHFHDDMIAMAEAAGACRFAEVTVATRRALTVAGQCEAGDILGLVEGEVNVIGQDLRQTCVALLDRMLGGGGELVTMVLGASAPAGLGDQLAAHLHHTWPFAEVRVYDGGQPHYPLLVGVE